MFIYFDGDNIPGSKDHEFFKLDKEDTVYLYYANKNTYYTKQENRDKLVEKCKCNIEWKMIESGNNAVDFAIAIDLMEKIYTEEHENIYCIISNDKHFNTIEKLIKGKGTKNLISQESSVKEALLKHKILTANNLMEFHGQFVKMYGDYYGNQVYDTLKKCFREQTYNISKFNRKERFNHFKNLFLKFKERC